MSTTRPTAHQVIVVGAGVGGAACALALAKRYGLGVLLIERHKGPGNLNRGESLLPPVTALLDKWGAQDRIRAAGARPVATMAFHHHRRGLVLDMPLTLPDVASPHLVLPHPKIEMAMVEAAQETGLLEVRYSTQVVRLLSDKGRVNGVVLREGGEETAVRAGAGRERPPGTRDLLANTSVRRWRKRACRRKECPKQGEEGRLDGVSHRSRSPSPEAKQKE